jgi:hypothetical protein
MFVHVKVTTPFGIGASYAPRPHECAHADDAGGAAGAYHCHTEREVVSGEVSDVRQEA